MVSREVKISLVCSLLSSLGILPGLPKTRYHTGSTSTWTDIFPLRCPRPCRTRPSLVSVVGGPAAAVPGSVLEVQSLMQSLVQSLVLHPRLTEAELHFNMVPRWGVCISSSRSPGMEHIISKINASCFPKSILEFLYAKSHNSEFFCTPPPQWYLLLWRHVGGTEFLQLKSNNRPHRPSPLFSMYLLSPWGRVWCAYILMSNTTPLLDYAN